MKSFALVSTIMAAQALAKRFLPGTNAKRGWQEGAGRNGTSGQMARFSKSSVAEVLDNPAESDINWTINLWTVFYEDSGTSRLRIEHKLYANIFATDTVSFEISFRPAHEADPTDTSTIGEDYVQCDMSQSSSDGAFWSASIAEGYYTCEGDTATNVCLYINEATDADKYTQNAESTSDWVTPYSDDDETDFWCTKANTEIGAALSPFECTELKCIIERDLDTGDADNDLRFTPTPSNPDALVIQPGRAKLYINKTLQNHAFAVTNDFKEAITLEVNTGATSLLISAISATAIAVSALAF